MTYRILAILLAVLAIGGYVYVQEGRVSAAETAASAAKDQVRTLTAERDQARSSVRVVTRYVDRIQVVREVGTTITKEIPVYVTAEADAACAIPAGFVRVHDAAAQNVPLAGTAGDPDAPAEGVALSDVAETVATNYTTCHETAEQVTGLQDYLTTLRAAIEAFNKQ